MNPYTYGIDISSHQGQEIELMDKHADSLTFVICRATDGITFVDSDFKLNWSTIHEKNFIAGAYHFFESHDDPSKQVANYLKAVGEISSTDLPPIVDFEGGGIDINQSVESVSANLLAVLNELKKLKPIAHPFYTQTSAVEINI
jgi:lysozyme